DHSQQRDLPAELPQAHRLVGALSSQHLVALGDHGAALRGGISSSARTRSRATWPTTSTSWSILHILPIGMGPVLVGTSSSAGISSSACASSSASMSMLAPSNWERYRRA